jgi:hypothetical protein
MYNYSNKPAEVPYVYQEYPKWVRDQLVQNEEEEEAALRGTDTADERAALLQAAADKGIKVDKRWSDDKIRAAIEAA